MPRAPRTPGRLAALLASFALALPFVVGVGAASGDDVARHANDTSDAAVVSTSGGDRFLTSVEVSRVAFDTGSATTVVMANGLNYPDALAGAPLAASLGAPMLLVPPGGVPQAVLDELDRLGATTVVLLGGPAALSADVQTQLEGEGLTVQRAQGANRFATAVAILDRMADTSSTAVLVEGINADPNRGWPDAVSASWMAAQLGHPILPVASSFIPGEIETALTANGFTNIIIVGGEAAVSADVVARLVALGFDADNITRLSGASRYATSAAVYDYAVARGADPVVRWVATGAAFADALSAAPAVAALGQTFLLLPPGGVPAGSATEQRLQAASDTLRQVRVLGGTGAIPQSTRDGIAALIDPDVAAAAFCLTVLHSNDGESNLEASGQFGGLPAFGAQIRRQQELAVAEVDDGCTDRGVVTVTSGDNFLPGPFLLASDRVDENGDPLQDPEPNEDTPVFDATALDLLGFDAFAIGNHDFDRGPDFLARFVNSITDTPFLAANLDVSAHAPLKALADAGRVKASTVVETGGREIGIVGFVTPLLETVSSPSPATVADTPTAADIAAAINAEVASLPETVDHVIVVSHLQGLDVDEDVVPLLVGVDAVVAGGGDELLAAPGDPLPPGAGAPFGTYPLTFDGADTPVVTTPGEYDYVGRLRLRFAANGDVTVGRGSRLIPVATGDFVDAVEPAQDVADVIQPALDFNDSLNEQVVAQTEVPLTANRNPGVRSQETGSGRLIADAFRQAVVDLDLAGDGDLGVVGLQNGGGIRTNNADEAGLYAADATTVAPADLTVADTFGLLPFGNLGTAVQDVDVPTLKSLLENAYYAVENGRDGRFAHVSGLIVTIDLSRDGNTYDEQDTLLTEGDRVTRIVFDANLDDVEDAGDTVLWDGTTATDDEVTVATLSFIVGGGDGYAFPEDGRVGLGGDAQLLTEFLEDLGTVPADDYPTLVDDDEGRLLILNRP